MLEVKIYNTKKSFKEEDIAGLNALIEKYNSENKKRKPIVKIKFNECLNIAGEIPIGWLKEYLINKNIEIKIIKPQTKEYKAVKTPHLQYGEDYWQLAELMVAFRTWEIEPEPQYKVKFFDKRKDDYPTLEDYLIAKRGHYISEIKTKLKGMPANGTLRKLVTTATKLNMVIAEEELHEYISRGLVEGKDFIVKYKTDTGVLFNIHHFKTMIIDNEEEIKEKIKEIEKEHDILESEIYSCI